MYGVQIQMNGTLQEVVQEEVVQQWLLVYVLRMCLKKNDTVQISV
jgi:hypothetical protein